MKRRALLRSAGLFGLTGPSVLAMRSSNAKADEAPRRGGRLVIGLNGDTKTLDPHVSQLTVWQNARRQIFEQLLRNNPDGTQSPLLAASFAWSDPTTLTVVLKTGVTFHNGSPFTSEDVKHTFDRLATPNLPSQYPPRLGKIASIEAPAPDRVVFHLTGPDVSFLDLLADIDIISKSVPVEKIPTTPVGTGAFKFVAWAPGESLRFARYDGYHVKGLPYLDEITYRPMPDSEARIASLLAGDIDVNFDVPIREVGRLGKSPHISTTKLRGGRLAIFYLNLRKPPFDDVRVRQAVLYAFDRKQYSADFLGGLGRPTNTPLDPANFAYNEAVETRYGYDPATAKALLAQAGYSDAKPLTFEVIYPVGLAEYQAISEYLQAQLAELGAEVKLTGMELAAWSNRIIKESNFQIAFDVRSVAETEPAIPYNDYTFTKPDKRNFDGFTAETVPGYLDVVEQALAEGDKAKRKALYARLQTLWADALPGYIMVAQPNFLVARDRVADYDKWGVQPFHLAEAWLRA